MENYDYIDEFENNCAIVIKTSKFGVINSDNKELIPVKYDIIKRYKHVGFWVGYTKNSNNLDYINIDNLLRNFKVKGFANLNGEIIVPPDCITLNNYGSCSLMKSLKDSKLYLLSNDGVLLKDGFYLDICLISYKGNTYIKTTSFDNEHSFLDRESNLIASFNCSKEDLFTVIFNEQLLIIYSDKESTYLYDMGNNILAKANIKSVRAQVESNDIDEDIYLILYSDNGIISVFDLDFKNIYESEGISIEFVTNDIFLIEQLEENLLFNVSKKEIVHKGSKYCKSYNHAGAILIVDDNYNHYFIDKDGNHLTREYNNILDCVDYKNEKFILISDGERLGFLDSNFSETWFKRYELLESSVFENLMFTEYRDSIIISINDCSIFSESSNSYYFNSLDEYFFKLLSDFPKVGRDDGIFRALLDIKSIYSK